MKWTWWKLLVSSSYLAECFFPLIFLQPIKSCWEQYQSTVCTHETGTQKSDFHIKWLFSFLPSTHLYLGLSSFLNLPVAYPHCRCKDIYLFPLSSPYCDHEGWKVAVSFLVSDEGSCKFISSFLWFLLYSLLSACFRSELMDSRRDSPKQTDTILKHSSPPKPSVYP